MLTKLVNSPAILNGLPHACSTVLLNKTRLSSKMYSTSLLIDLPIAGYVGMGTGALAIGTVLFALARYKVSHPDQYLVRTGLGISDMTISKTGFQWPFQGASFISMRPINYSFTLDAMSNQMMEFMLPGSFTIGPKNDPESLKKYSRYLLGDKPDGIDVLVKGVIEGETRVLAAQMSLDEIFSDRSAFKEKIIKNIQGELDKYGLEILNANIKELQDKPGSQYFSLRRQKTCSEAEGKARIDTSEAKKIADIGEKLRNAETRKEVAEYEAQAVEKENECKKRIYESNTKLSIAASELNRQTEIAKVEAEKLSKIRESELQKELELRHIGQETEYLRAQNMSKAQVSAETAVKDAEGQQKATEIIADATLYKQTKRSSRYCFYL